MKKKKKKKKERNKGNTIKNVKRSAKIADCSRSSALFENLKCNPKS